MSEGTFRDQEKTGDDIDRLAAGQRPPHGTQYTARLAWVRIGCLGAATVGLIPVAIFFFLLAFQLLTMGSENAEKVGFSPMHGGSFLLIAVCAAGLVVVGVSSTLRRAGWPRLWLKSGKSLHYPCAGLALIGAVLPLLPSSANLRGHLGALLLRLVLGLTGIALVLDARRTRAQGSPPTSR